MKKYSILFLMFSLATSFAVAQNIELPSSKEKVIEINESKDHLYSKAIEWMLSSFGSERRTIEYSDKEVGIIRGREKPLIPSVSTQKQKDFAVITITVKDKILNIKASPNDPLIYKDSLEAKGFNANVDILLQGFELYMKKKTKD